MKGTITGYTMEQAHKIMMYSPIRAMLLDQQDTDYPAFMELYRLYISKKYKTLQLLSMAFSLGRAIGTRDERARRSGKDIVQPGQEAIDVAIQTVKEKVVNREIKQMLQKLDATSISATLATVKAMVGGKCNADAIAAGNAILTGAGRDPVSLDALNSTEAPAHSA